MLTRLEVSGISFIRLSHTNKATVLMTKLRGCFTLKWTTFLVNRPKQKPYVKRFSHRI